MDYYKALKTVPTRRHGGMQAIEERNVRRTQMKRAPGVREYRGDKMPAILAFNALVTYACVSPFIIMNVIMIIDPVF